VKAEREGERLSSGERSVSIFAVPYDSGHRALRMGAGPQHFLSNGMENALAATGHAVSSEILEARSSFLTEITTTFELLGEVARRVRGAAGSGDLPLVLSGNCIATVGVVAGLAGAWQQEELGVVWFDGHADFNTPETTTSASLDGMGLATAVGHCWVQIARTIPGFRPVREDNVVLVGGRGADSPEKERLRDSGVSVVEERRIQEASSAEALGAALDTVRGRVGRVHVHLDLDVLDPDVVDPANEFAPEGGLTAEEVEGSIRVIRERLEVTSATVASYDPSFDWKGRVLDAGIAFARNLVS
jgi:arginase